MYGQLKADIGKILRTLCEQKKVNIIEAEACPDHIHMLVEIPPNISVSEGKRVSEETAKAAYRKITFDHVQYVMKSLVSYPDKISRIDRFLTVSLFNSVYTLTNSTFAGFKYDMRMKML